MKAIFFITAMTACYQCYSQNNVPSADVQIKSAVLAAPPEKRIAAQFMATLPINNSFF
jgi:hypothetical protein